MSQTSNNNNFMPVIFPIMIPVMIPVIILVMIPVRMTVMTPFMYSGPIYYLFLFWICVVLVMYSRFDYRMIYKSDSIRLNIRWHETIVYR